MNFGKEILEKIVSETDSEYGKVFLENFIHFENIYYILNGKYHYGCGSYLFDGSTYKFFDKYFKKQESLYNTGKNLKGENCLELGVYLGHSLLILLLSNPKLKITCIDIDSSFSPTVVSYLNQHFDNRLNFMLGDSIENMKKLVGNKYDLIHLDSDHSHAHVTREFNFSKSLANNGTIFVFDDYEAVKNTVDDWIYKGDLDVVDCPLCFHTNIVTKFVNYRDNIVTLVKPFTCLSRERIISNTRAIQHVIYNNIEGDIVEIGVWKGGSVLSMMKTLEIMNVINKNIRLYDTFSGMTLPTDIDEDLNGNKAADIFENVKCDASIDIVKNNIYNNSNYPKELIHFHIGPIENTNIFPEKISFLRLDTDWYESTKFELEKFYPLVSKGGIVMLDDVGHWKGAKKAFEEFLEDKNNISVQKIDYTGVFFVKNE